jgi:hypothetical protein
MQWFKHDSTASQDFKIKRLRLKHGFWGYGLYWYIIERIQGEVSLTNTSLSLEDDTEIIALDWGVSVEEVQEAMDTMVALKLFYINQNGQLVCPTLAKRLSKDMSGNPKMRDLIDLLKENFNSIDPGMTQSIPSHDSVMIESCKKEKKDKNIIDKNILDESVHTTSEQTDIITNHQPPQAKEVNQVDIFKRSIDNSASTIGGEVVPIQGSQGVKEPMTVNWAPDEVTRTRLYQKGIPLEFIDETIEVFKSHYLETGQQFSSWQTKCFQWVIKDWNGKAAHWKSSEQLKAAGNQATATATLNQMMSNDW